MIRTIFTIVALACSTPAQALEPLTIRPDVPPAVPGQCAQNYALNKGKLFPQKLVGVANPAVSSCSAVVVPLSDYADLLATERWAEAVKARYELDTSMLQTELTWTKARLEQELKPPPWMDRPSTQRWFGRVETIVIVGVVSIGLASAYSYGSGVGK